jgi:hypothetical protein
MQFLCNVGGGVETGQVAFVRRLFDARHRLSLAEQTKLYFNQDWWLIDG